jgi:hypothetical protein
VKPHERRNRFGSGNGGAKMTDTSELVRRLRFWMPIGSKHLEADLAEAADRLEALEAECERLRTAGLNEFKRFEAGHEENKRLRDYMQAAISEIDEGDVGFERRALKWLADGLTARSALKGD